MDDHYDTNLSSEEVYKLFLNGELTAAQKVYIRYIEEDPKEEQVTIDELFWNNDIEYCFGDIDGDGSTESDGEFHWSDKNKDGIMDEEDAYRNSSPYEEIEMGQYGIWVSIQKTRFWKF